jgi:hypothetical protein
MLRVSLAIVLIFGVLFVLRLLGFLLRARGGRAPGASR